MIIKLRRRHIYYNLVYTLIVTLSASVQTGSGPQPISYTKVPGLFWGKAAGTWRGVDHPIPSSPKVKQRVVLYLYSTSEPSWPVLGWTLPLPLPLPLHIDIDCTSACHYYWFSLLSFAVCNVAVLHTRWINNDTKQVVSYSSRQRNTNIRTFSTPLYFKWLLKCK
jgi:hypothetical protein